MPADTSAAATAPIARQALIAFEARLFGPRSVQTTVYRLAILLRRGSTIPVGVTGNRGIGSRARIAHRFATSHGRIRYARGHGRRGGYAATVVGRRVQVGSPRVAVCDLHTTVLRPVWRPPVAGETILCGATGHVGRQGTCRRTVCNATVPVRRTLRRRGHTQNGLAVLRRSVRPRARVSSGCVRTLDGRVHLAGAGRQCAAKTDSLGLRHAARTLDHVGPEAARSCAQEPDRVRAARHARVARAAVGRGHRDRLLGRSLRNAGLRDAAFLPPACAGRCVHRRWGAGSAGRRTGHHGKYHRRRKGDAGDRSTPIAHDVTRSLRLSSDLIQA